MKEKRKRWSTDEKIRIVLQTFKTEANLAEICRQNNLSPRTVYNWKDRFLAAAREGFNGTSAESKANAHKKEVAGLKRIIGEYAVANYALKKTMGGERE